MSERVLAPSPRQSPARPSCQRLVAHLCLCLSLAFAGISSDGIIKSNFPFSLPFPRLRIRLAFSSAGWLKRNFHPATRVVGGKVSCVRHRKNGSMTLQASPIHLPSNVDARLPLCCWLGDRIFGQGAEADELSGLLCAVHPIPPLAINSVFIPPF